MQVKKYIGTTLQQALQMAKEELGEDLILLESREVKGGTKYPGRKRLVEVTVGIDDASPEVKPWSPPGLGRKKGRPPSPSAEVPETPPAQEPPSPNEFSQLVAQILDRKRQDIDKEKRILEEIARLREEINKIARQQEEGEDEKVPPRFQRLSHFLQDSGLSAELTEKWLEEIRNSLGKEKEWRDSDLVGQVKQKMRPLFRAWKAPKVSGQRRILLLGSTGSGKTTTAMKLAAAPEFFGGKKVGIVSTDSFGIPEPLKIFTRLTQIRVEEARNLDALPLALDALKNCEVVIVDSPGRSPFAPDHLNSLEAYIQRVQPTDIFLVLSMTTGERDLLLACGFYMLMKPNGIVFTKFDETSQPAKVFSVLQEVHLPVVGFCNGTGVFSDIHPPELDFLFEQIFDKA